VRNQAQPASGFNAFTEDAVLSAAIARDAPWAAARCAALGAVAGDEAVQELARRPTATCPSCRPTTGLATGWTGWNSIPPGTS
jgi:putative acyl-CoA dehydrogenase